MEREDINDNITCESREIYLSLTGKENKDTEKNKQNNKSLFMDEINKWTICIENFFKEPDKFLYIVQQQMPDIKNKWMDFITSLYEKKDTRCVQITACMKQSQNYADIKSSVFKLIEFAKEIHLCFKVVLDCSKITLENGNYKETDQFKQKKIRYNNEIKRNVFKVTDFGTNTIHAMKKIPLRNVNEVKCLVDLKETGFVPKLYLIRWEENQIYLHMELLVPALTSEEACNKIPNKYRLWFARYYFEQLLTAYMIMYEKGWSHGDLHDRNVLILDNLQIIIIDFETACKNEENAIIDDLFNIITQVFRFATGKQIARVQLQSDSGNLATYCDNNSELTSLAEMTLSIPNKDRSGANDMYNTVYLNDINKENSKFLKENFDEMFKNVRDSLFPENANRDIQNNSNIIKDKSSDLSNQKD